MIETAHLSGLIFSEDAATIHFKVWPLQTRKILFTYKLTIDSTRKGFFYFSHWLLDTAMILGYIIRFVFNLINSCFWEAALNYNCKR
jgi:hypothetical protein